MARLLILILTLQLFGCRNVHSQILKIEFHPSFIYGSSIEVNLETGSCTIGYDSLNTATLNFDMDGTSELISFFESYDFKIKGSVDTTGYTSDGKPIMSIGMDGITVSGSFENKKFQFWSPKKGSENFRLIEILFRNLYKSSNEIDSLQTYLKLLEQYFPFGTPIKKLSDNPLTYKIYGSLTINDKPYLDSLVQFIPERINVIIDASNFTGTGTLLYPTFKELDRKTNATWIMPRNEHGKRQLREAGIKFR